MVGISHYELFVINDGSTEGGTAVAKTFQDPRIRYVDQENAGVSCARNRVDREAKADLIAFRDSAQ